jgi:hypothetical protein
MKIVNRLLPNRSGEEGDHSRAGRQLPLRAPEWMTRLADRATARNNEDATSSINR